MPGDYHTQDGMGSQEQSFSRRTDEYAPPPPPRPRPRQPSSWGAADSHSIQHPPTTRGSDLGQVSNGSRGGAPDSYYNPGSDARNRRDASRQQPPGHWIDEHPPPAGAASWAKTRSRSVKTRERWPPADEESDEADDPLFQAAAASTCGVRAMQ